MAINCLGVSWTLVLWGFHELLLANASLQSISKGLPSPPRNLYTTSYEFNKILHFTAANSTGGLSTNYTVYLDCTPNCTLENKGSLYVPRVLQDCESLKHFDGKSYKCDLASADLFTVYRATVYAINSLGNTSASIKFKRPDVTFPCTIPEKPIQPVATEIQPGKVRITWQNQNNPEYSDITYFRIEYREKGSNENKTWPKDEMGTDTTVVIDNLNADSVYYFYVKKQFRASKLFSPFSAPAVVSLHTKYAEPQEPPQALNCSAIKDDFNVTIVWVSWKAPSEKHRNGQRVTYNITYSIAGSKNKTIVIANANQTNINLTIPKLFKRMQISAVACNNHGCSSISNSCFVEGQPNLTISPRTPNGDKTAIMIVGVILAIILTVIVVVGIICCRKKKTTPRKRLQMDLDTSPYCEMYDEPEDNEDEHDYDRPLV